MPLGGSSPDAVLTYGRGLLQVGGLGCQPEGMAAQCPQAQETASSGGRHLLVWYDNTSRFRALKSCCQQQQAQGNVP